MAYREFTAARREQRREPIEFGLRGERFSCVSVLPAWVVMDLQAAEADGDSAAMRAFQQLIRHMLVDDDVARFIELVTRKEVFAKPAEEGGEETAAFDPVGDDELGDIVAWLLEQFTGHPTKGSTASLDGPQTTSPSLTDSSPNGAMALVPSST